MDALPAGNPYNAINLAHIGIWQRLLMSRTSTLSLCAAAVMDQPHNRAPWPRGFGIVGGMIVSEISKPLYCV